MVLTRETRYVNILYLQRYENIMRRYESILTAFAAKALGKNLIASPQATYTAKIHGL